MAELRPVSRARLIARLAELGFLGPFSGGRHQYMERGDITVRIPNPHGADIGIDLLARILRQGGISRTEWLGP